jgi:hypothetical protein
MPMRLAKHKQDIDRTDRSGVHPCRLRRWPEAALEVTLQVSSTYGCTLAWASRTSDRQTGANTAFLFWRVALKAVDTDIRGRLAKYDVVTLSDRGWHLVVSIR